MSLEYNSFSALTPGDPIPAIDLELPVPLTTEQRPLHHVSVSDLRTAESVIAVTRGLDDILANQADAAVSFDLSGLGKQATAVSPQWGSVLSNIISSRYQDVWLRPEMPKTKAGQVQLARAGVYFALARHQRLDWASLSKSTVQSLEPWTEDWHPAEMQQPLFRVGDERRLSEVPKRLAPDLVAFLNPDRTPREDTLLDQEAVVYPWLRELIGTRRQPSTREWRRQLCRDTSTIAGELLDNVRDHAHLTHNGLCSLATYATTGSKEDRLYLTVQDTGVGMPRTLHSRTTAVNDAALVAQPFNGELPLRERAHGQGLRRLTELVDRLGSKAQLFAATGPSSDGSAITLRHQGGAGRVVTEHLPGLPLHGTVVVMTLPLSTESASNAPSE